MAIVPTLHRNSRHLIDTLIAAPSLDGRFENLRIANKGVRGRGCLSLIFSAVDNTDGARIALKFFDPAWLGDAYRLNAFEREHKILQTLTGKSRCLQVLGPLQRFNLPIKLADGTDSSIPCGYFATPWLDGDIELTFENQDRHDATDKLQLFNDMVLAVEALHRNGVFHRDLKPDNFRSYLDGGRRIVLAIDLGTAARLESSPMASIYGAPVGARAYAPPEAACGLASNRAVGSAADQYALGCMLWQLFNPGLHFLAMEARNPTYGLTQMAMQSYVAGIMDHQQQLERWKIAVTDLGGGIAPTGILGAAHTVPLGITDQLNALVNGLTHVDYRKRTPLPAVRSTLQSALLVLKHVRLHRMRIDQMRRRRQQRLAKIAAREQRLRALEAKNVN